MKNKKKILLISDVDNWGGAERARYIKKYLSDEYDFDFMANEEFSEWEEFSDTNFIHVGAMQGIINKFQPAYTKQWFPIPEMIKYKEARLKYKRDYDLYYLMFHTMLCSQQVKRIAYGGGKIFSAITGFPVIKEVFENERQDQGKAASFLRLAKMSEGFAINNMKAYNELKEIYLDKEVNLPFWYTPRGVDPDVFYPENYRLWKKNDNINPSFPPPPEDYFHCVFVGKDRSGKGLHSIIKPACNETGTKMLTNERNYTNALTKDQMRGLYNKAHVYCVASETDGTPNPALEAAACGRPIIANAIGNMPEFIVDGYNGFLVEKNIEAYKEKLLFLKNNPEKAKEMGQNARQTVLDGWTWKHSTDYERIALKEIFECMK